MIIKTSKSYKTTLSQFDLLGNNEMALSKAFAYLLGVDEECYFEFIRFLGIKEPRNTNNYSDAEITVERKRDAGRTDIELSRNNHYLIIIECKVGNNKLNSQRSQYLAEFNGNFANKVLCFITQERDTNKEIANDVSVVNTSWFEIIELYSHKKYSQKQIVQSFLKFATKNYKMKELKEVLIQDVNRAEIERFERFNIYRRNQTFGTPIYFAPYYTRSSGQTEGISNLSKILGILTTTRADIDSFIDDLKNFSNNDELIDNWVDGVKHGNDNEKYTYYFLDKPLKLPSPLRKDGGKEKGRGKNWIAAQIPPNRCVSFIEFIKHLPELNLKDS